LLKACTQEDRDVSGARRKRGSAQHRETRRKRKGQRSKHGKGGFMDLFLKIEPGKRNKCRHGADLWTVANCKRPGGERPERGKKGPFHPGTPPRVKFSLKWKKNPQKEFRVRRNGRRRLSLITGGEKSQRDGVRGQKWDERQIRSAAHLKRIHWPQRGKTRTVLGRQEGVRDALGQI